MGGKEFPDIRYEGSGLYVHIPSGISIERGENDVMARVFHSNEFTVREGEKVLGVVHCYLMDEPVRHKKMRAWKEEYGTDYRKAPLAETMKFSKEFTIANGVEQIIPKMEGFSNRDSFLRSNKFQIVLMLLFCKGDIVSSHEDNILDSKIYFSLDKKFDGHRKVFHSPIRQLIK
ncbi:hypothetical protein [Roseobacter sp. HKCCA0434]|uniref:hypothetical protein n=1 Tax=Roseobacter sp. HKCCA0434 TaxID=3079297 RepID=UPI002905ED5A|nr:hypothetical protein [Roseobacter sp. HKCCA0434]